ncbi:hypothetical protein SLEP1_g41115 [Rubroshorea leprosula]|uniref:NB-ARC domain-containing protein n=1 Tax=Rubroshorea leprosula TaxID=152421 RepID=A0AAV5L6T4_9ROSI|nr:hypothetical protein SLEP1_g41115 [Rubroshorea leprosula]
MQGENYTNDSQGLVIDDHSIKGVSQFVEECKGRDDIRDQILEWLKGDEVTRIAVSGMGGVGKTTIMKQVHNQLLKEPKFNKVIWVKVSRDFDIIVQQKRKFDILKFQKRIASSLGLELKPEDHENETKLAGLISQNLRQGNSVLILDDLILTTWLQEVAHAMECDVISVNPPPPKEALALFLEKVGSVVLSDGKIKVDIKPFLEQILQKCGGVPLAIVTVAKSMRGKLLPPPQCQVCFLYCALCPEDAEIYKKELIEYWIEEGLIYKEGKTREAMYWKGHDILDKLVDNCLLESAGVALEKLPKEHEWSEDLLKVSLMWNHITEIPSSMSSPKCPMLTTLLLSNNSISTIPKAFFEHMLGLKILDLSNNRELSRLPTSISKLEKHTTLLLKGCNSLREKLQIVKVFGCEQLEEIIGFESEEGEKVTLPKLERLKLIELPQLKSIYSGSLICDSIKKIEIEGCYNIESVFWSGFNPLPNLEYLYLFKLENLKSVFNEEDLGLSPLVPPTSFFSLKEIRVELYHQLKKVFSFGWLLRYFQSLETVKVQCCSRMEEPISSSADVEEKVTLSKLQGLKLTQLSQLKTTCSGFNPLPNLEYLGLCDLWNLKSVFDEEGIGLLPCVPPIRFFSLKEIRVDRCDQLKKVFSSRWLLHYFQSLETIKVQMEKLISSSAHEEEKVTIPKLQSLELTELPQLKSICSSSSVLICDSIQSLRISDCEKLKRIPLNFPLLDNARSSHPSSLKEIVVWPKEWWESLEWDHPNAKDILFPFCKFQQKRW